MFEIDQVFQAKSSIKNSVSPRIKHSSLNMRLVISEVLIGLLSVSRKSFDQSFLSLEIFFTVLIFRVKNSPFLIKK